MTLCTKRIVFYVSISFLNNAFPYVRRAEIKIFFKFTTAVEILVLSIVFYELL